MNRRSLLRLALIGGLFLTLPSPTLPATHSQALTVKFCNLARSPNLYAGEIIRTKAVLVENHTPRVDGGDPLLYVPACRDKEALVLADWAQLAPAESRALPELGIVRAKVDKHGHSRALTTVVGKFECAGRYGHLDWAEAQLVIYAVEKVQRVSASVRWPKEYD